MDFISQQLPDFRILLELGYGDDFDRTHLLIWVVGLLEILKARFIYFPELSLSEHLAYLVLGERIVA